MIRHVAYKAAKAGILTGVLLAIARISGETAPLLFTALNNQFMNLNILEPMASLPAVIFQFALSPYADWQRLAWTGAMLITFAVLALSIVARSSARKDRSHECHARSRIRARPRSSPAPATERISVKNLNFYLRRIARA